MTRKGLLGGLLACAILLVLASGTGCNLIKNTADTSVKGGENAGGIAKKMHNGTVGDTDMDTGESSSDKSDSDAGSGGGE